MNEHNPIAEATVLFQESKWHSETFRTYYNLFFQEKAPLLQAKQYPESLSLGDDPEIVPIHNTLRDLTRDGNERWSMIGYLPDKKHIYFSNQFAQGTEHGVNRQTIARTVQQEVASNSVEIIGSQHSHSVNRSGEMIDSFSANDLYALLPQGNNHTLLFLVAGKHVLFATRAADSTFVDPDLSQESLRQFWLGQLNISTEPTKLENEKIMHGILKEHNLICYKGFINDTLYRIQPALA
jgi:hypothetical protein